MGRKEGRRRLAEELSSNSHHLNDGWKKLGAREWLHENWMQDRCKTEMQDRNARLRVAEERERERKRDTD